jgi:mono/diheme cytochrome c family protein
MMSRNSVVRHGWRTAGAVLVMAGALAMPIRAHDAAAPRDRQTKTPNRSTVVSTVPITPVEGPSTLHHLGLTIEESSMGWAGQWSPPFSAPQSAADARLRSEPAGGPFVLTGADLYRISCRACHKADGTGAPPEVHSLVGPVQSASVQWMTADMKARGRDLGAAFVKQLTTATEADLRTRLRQGGHNMPSFAQISDQEYAVLRPYLDELAGVPSAKTGPRSITEPADRVGELVVKGTCHICHDATQANQRPTTVMSGVIPSLASFPSGKTGGDFVHKVKAGAQVPLSAGGVMSRGRMPVFDYLTEPEVASAYSYLMTYRPR